MADHAGMGIVADERYVQQALFEAAGSGCWIARPVETPDATPLQFEQGPNIAATLREWPSEHVVKCQVSYHPAMTESVRGAPLATLQALSDACARTAHELLLEVRSPEGLGAGPGTSSQSLGAIYDAGVYPDWWTLAPPADSAGWADITRIIEDRDPYCRGVLLWGGRASLAELEGAIETARGQRICRGFAIGRAIFGDAAEAWFAGRLDDVAAVSAVAENYDRLVTAWQRACAA